MKINDINALGALQNKIIADVWNSDGKLLKAGYSAAIESIKNTGFPTSKAEEWRFTDIKSILQQDYELARDNREKDLPIKSDPTLLHAAKIVIVNGVYRADLSQIPETLKEKIIIGNINEIISGKNDKLTQRLTEIPQSVFAALNAALFNGGVGIIVADNVDVDIPVHVSYYTVNNSGRAIIDTPRNILALGKNSRLQLLESYFSDGNSFSFANILNQFWIGEGANLAYYKIRRASANGSHLHNLYVNQETESRADLYTVDFGGKLTRNTLEVKMEGRNIKTLANGVYFAKDDELVDNHVFIDHAQENGVSSELYRGILADKARGVFRGKILVRPHAQKTDADQNNNCLLLSDTARINTMPQLEIYADDVKCTHGATVGELDDESVFYLRSRGIGLEQAKNILIKAFIAEVLETVENGEIKYYIESFVDEYLGSII